MSISAGKFVKEQNITIVMSKCEIRHVPLYFRNHVLRSRKVIFSIKDRNRY